MESIDTRLLYPNIRKEDGTVSYGSLWIGCLVPNQPRSPSPTLSLSLVERESEHESPKKSRASLRTGCCCCGLGSSSRLPLRSSSRTIESNQRVLLWKKGLALMHSDRSTLISPNWVPHPGLMILPSPTKLIFRTCHIGGEEIYVKAIPTMVSLER